MQIQNFTILAGTNACNARCPYCISRMTPLNGMERKKKINWRNFRKACVLTQKSGVDSVIISGKGEPILFPHEITQFLRYLNRFEFPIIELQTNGILLDLQYSKYKKFLKQWYKLGLTTIALSVVHYLDGENRKIFTNPDDYMDLSGLIKKLHCLGFSVRLACVMIKGYIDTPKKITKLLEYAKNNQVEQLTVRPVNKPYFTEEKQSCKWVEKNSLSKKQKELIKVFFEKNAVPLIRYDYGAVVYDYKGQNICITNSLTSNPESTVRQLIFFPDGHLRYDWQYKGAVII